MIRLKTFVPWLLTAGFALLFAGTLLLRSTSTPNTQSMSPSSSLVPGQTPPASNPRLGPEPTEVKQVIRVIDGDTIEIEGGVHVRYIGIDTPEVGQCLADQATAENSQFVAGKDVKLETDIEKYDKYGRLLAYVFVDNIFVNKKLVQDGFAMVTTYPPDVKYVDQYLAAQKEAKDAGRGLWSQNPCPTPISTATSSNQCTIKGNISSSGEKIYHIQGQRYYEKTKIDEDKGEHWFCTEEEAVQAGWRKSKI